MYQTEITTNDDIVVTNYQEILPMTFEEKVNMYMKCSKLELAKMLAERDRLEQYIPTPAPQFVPYPYPPNSTPAVPYDAWWLRPITTSDSECTADDYVVYCTQMQKESD